MPNVCGLQHEAIDQVEHRRGDTRIVQRLPTSVALRQTPRDFVCRFAGRTSFLIRSLASLLAILGSMLWAEDIVAQQVPTDPTSTHIFPAGGRRGTQVAVRVGGECLPPGTRFRLSGEGITAPAELGDPATANYAPSPRRKPGELPMNYPREWQSELTVADGAPLGVHLWRLSCARGGTGGRPFIVGDLPEFIESEPNSLPDQAEQVQLPMTINGQIAGESDLDYFRFDAKEGDVVRVDVAAARLGSTLDPIIQILDPQGHRVAVDDRRLGADPILAFQAMTSGEYRLLITNVTFKGGPSYVYRATISTTPLIQYAFPAGGQAGSTSQITFFALSGAGPLQKLTGNVSFPGMAGEFWKSGLPGANEVPFQVSELPESIETVGNDTRDSATALAWPLFMNGQFETADDQDWYRLQGRQGIPLTIECSPHPRWSPSLPIVGITDANGQVLASASAVQSLRGTIRIQWQPPADGTYWLRLQDQQFNVSGGPEFIYRLRVEQAVPDFAVLLKSDVINVVQGGRTEVDIAIERRGGCIAPVELVIDGIPEGIRLEGQQIASNAISTKLSFIADDNARSGDVTLHIKGKAEINGNLIERQASATHLGHDVDGIGLGPSETDHVQLTVVHKPVFKLYCNEAYQYAHRGTIYPYLMEIERLDGFDGPIRLQVADRQIKDLDGIEIVATTIAPGESRVMLPIYLPETMHINVQAHSNVYAQGYVEFQDKFNQKQTMLVVSTMRCMIRTLPTVAKLRPVHRELVVQPGSPVRCPLALDRTTQFSGPVKVELVDPAPGVTAEPITIAAGQSEAEVVVRIDPTRQMGPKRMLHFRAVGKMAGESTLVTEAKMPFAIQE